jgi:GDP-4-dehydro-6-deoxy-D-mannose reductase
MKDQDNCRIAFKRERPKKMDKSRILLTGATGFVGPRLLKALRKSIFCDAEIFVWTYGPDSAASSDPLNIDIRCRDAVFESIASIKPTHIIHLAAQSHVPTSFSQPELTWDINVKGSLHLFEAVKKYVPTAGILYISSSEVYGSSFQTGKPVTETALLQPQNPYAASKAATDLMAGQYGAQGMKIIRMRPFNHVGPGQSEDFVISSFAAQIARIEKGQQPAIIHVGNLDASRDFLSVDDVVQAYLVALQKLSELPAGLVLNICSGVPRKIKDILDSLISYASCPIDIEIDPKRIRPSDTPIATGANSAAKHYLAWQPQIKFETTLLQILNDWRRKVGGKR